MPYNAELDTWRCNQCGKDFRTRGLLGHHIRECPIGISAQEEADRVKAEVQHEHKVQTLLDTLPDYIKGEREPSWMEPFCEAIVDLIEEK